MKTISVNVLAHQVDAANISISSLEGDIYVAHAHMGEDAYPITDKEGAPLRARSIHRMHELLEDVSIRQASLVMSCAYDEMIGLDSADERPVEVPLSW